MNKFQKETEGSLIPTALFLIIILLPEQSCCSQEESGVCSSGAVVFQEAHWPFPFIPPIPKNYFQSLDNSAEQYINRQGQHRLYKSSIWIYIYIWMYHIISLACFTEILNFFSRWNKVLTENSNLGTDFSVCVVLCCLCLLF